MRSVRVATHWMPLLAAVVLGMGCGGAKTEGTDQAAPAAQEPVVAVSAIEVGHGLDADKRVLQATTTFTSKDTIYASVLTNGVGSDVEIKARWTYQDGQVVNESSQMISPTGAAATEFHIAKPDGWPAGTYKVEVFLNGNSAGTKDFTVQ